MKIRHVIRYAIPVAGTIHFSVGLLWWCDLLFCVVGLEALASLPTNRLLQYVVFPLQLCLLLLAGFATALYFTYRNSQFANRLTLASVCIACLLFALSATSSAAQVHVLGRPGLNHFYATWWLYSRFPPLSIAGRTLVAIIILIVSISLIRCCKYLGT